MKALNGFLMTQRQMTLKDNVALLSGPVVYSVLLILLVTLWQNMMMMMMMMMIYVVYKS